MRLILAVAAIVTTAAGSVAAQGTCPASRICSTLGFSFQPPAGSAWKAEVGREAPGFRRTTNPGQASMYAGAIEVRNNALSGDKDALVSFVRGKKSVWGSDGRFRNVKESYAIEGAHGHCVRYRQTAEDTRAKGQGGNPSLRLLNVGRFCLHPTDRANAVDLFYSIRHAPDFAIGELEAEGESILDSLRFSGH